MFQVMARLCGGHVIKTLDSSLTWPYNPPLGIAMRSNVGTSFILKTYGDLFRKCFFSSSSLDPVEKVYFTPVDLDAQASSHGDQPVPLDSDTQYDCSSDSTLYSPQHLKQHHYQKADAQTQTTEGMSFLDNSVQAATGRYDSQIQAEPKAARRCYCSCSPGSGTATEPPSPASVYSQASASVSVLVDDDPEYLEYTMVASNVPDPVRRTPMQNFALTDLLTISILPTYIKAFEDAEEELEFRQRIGELLKEYKPMTSAVFLALQYMERSRNRINTINTFYWWFMLCLLYAHQTLDDFGTITAEHVGHFMNIDPSFVERRQRIGYKALEYNLRISQIDWVYFLNHIRVSVGGLPLASAEAILQLITESLPIPSASPKDEVLNPLRWLEKALEEDKLSVEQYQCVWKQRVRVEEA